MKIRVCVSDKMTNDSILGPIEDRLIRVPRTLREEIGLIQGLYLDFTDVSGNKIWLQVSTAYHEDANADDSCVYVTQSTKDLLSVSKSSRLSPAEDILIGCDPEFFLVDRNNGERISASHFFPHQGEIGSDFYLAELRPRPHPDCSNLVMELSGLLHRAYSHIQNRRLYRQKDIHLISVSNYRNASAGFHVHFGLPYVFLKQSSIRTSLMQCMVSVLDYYVGIPSILPEGNVDTLRRTMNRCGYGRPGDYRVDRVTLEYRVPGAHLLRHPMLTAGLLSMSIVVMKDMLSRFQAYTDNYRRDIDIVRYDDMRRMYPRLPERRVVKEAMTSHGIHLALSHLDNILTDYTKMFGYKKNSSEIINFFSYVLNHVVKGEYFSENLEENWRLSNNEGQQRKMAVFHAPI